MQAAYYAVGAHTLLDQLRFPRVFLLFEGGKDLKTSTEK